MDSIILIILVSAFVWGYISQFPILIIALLSGYIFAGPLGVIVAIVLSFAYVTLRKGKKGGTQSNRANIGSGQSQPTNWNSHAKYNPTYTKLIDLGK